MTPESSVFLSDFGARFLPETEEEILQEIDSLM